MKRSQLLFVLTLAAICILTLGVPYAATSAAVQHGFRIKEYELFHDVLHPLQHEALPQGDFPRIRSVATELVTRGKAIVKLGVPEAPKPQRREFTKALRKFDKALATFKADAKGGSDIRLKKSFTAVHDSFEELADLVPRVYPGGPPPVVVIKCPSGNVEAGSAITLTADTPTDDGLAFLWTVGAAKILTGQGTRTITMDTMGLAGQTISVRVELNDGFGHTANASCLVQIAGE